MGYAQLQVKYFEDLIKFIFNLNRDIKSNQKFIIK